MDGESDGADSMDSMGEPRKRYYFCRPESRMVYIADSLFGRIARLTSLTPLSGSDFACLIDSGKINCI